jgi:hypothetical protein
MLTIELNSIFNVMKIHSEIDYTLIHLILWFAFMLNYELKKKSYTLLS